MKKATVLATGLAATLCASQLSAATITALDIQTASGTSGDLGTQSITIGDFTIETINSVNLGSDVNGDGDTAIGTTTNDDNQFEGASGLEVSFDSAVQVQSMIFGLHGNSDGNLLISGFASDPGASSTFGSDSFSSGTVTITPSGFTNSYTITFSTPVDVTLLSFTTTTTTNNGVGFLGITYVPEPGSLALLGVGGLCMMKRRRRD